MSKMKENKAERISKIVEKWKNYSNAEEKKDKSDDPLTCLHDHCSFWRRKFNASRKIKDEEQE
jgi:hypothetical protein